jgi:glycine cleavage system H lipoate-binding protein
MVLLGLLLVPVLIGLFGWYWLTQVYDGLVGIRRVGHLRWRPDSYYTTGHLWLRPMSRQTVRVGVDDIAQRVLPDVESITLAQAGTCVRRGEPIAQLEWGRGHVAVLRAPVAGTIAAANPRLVHTPALLHRDPYRRGWVVDITPQEDRFDRFVAQGAAWAWLATEERRLTGQFEGALGMAAADGGELMHTPPETLTEDQWSAIRAAFLEPEDGVHRTTRQVR